MTAFGPTGSTNPFGVGPTPSGPLAVYALAISACRPELTKNVLVYWWLTSMYVIASSAAAEQRKSPP